MAIVTGLTAVRMLQIEAASIVSGEVDPTGELTLTTHGGLEIAAGNVKGPQGDPGDQGDAGLDAALVITPKTAAELPDSYPAPRISTFTFGAGTDWPVVLGTVFSYIENVSRGFQLVVEKNSSTFYMRVVNNNDWGPWSQLATRAYVDGLIKPLELDGSTNLNTLRVQSGTYVQSSNSEPTLILNYPVARAGLLEVLGPANVDGVVWQRYTLYHSGTADQVSSYVRGYSNGSWSTWKLERYDSDWVNITPSSGFSSSPTSTQVAATCRRQNNDVRLQGVLSGTITVNTTITIGVLPVGYRPLINDTNLRAIPTTNSFVGSANITKAGAITAHFKSPLTTGSYTLELGSLSFSLD